MPGITSILTEDHRHGDRLFAAAMRAAEEQNWSECRRDFDAFLETLNRHLKIEEAVLFPAFEAATGMAGGPTFVMRHEHQQMRAILERIGAALEARNSAEFHPLARSFSELMDAHSAKEERMLYPMCDRNLPDFDVEQLKSTLTPQS
jgi:hemerythrin-like domain-containing protein